MKTSIIILALVSTLCLTGCDKDCKKGGQSKPPPSDTQKVPDAPSTLQLSAIAAIGLAALALTRNERPE